ncbi:unnamed protein product [Rotaria magnacalcarata]
MNTCSFTFISLRNNLPCRVMGIERTWDYLKNEFDREGNGLSDPTARYFETIGPGPQLFAVVYPSIYYHDQQQWFKYKMMRRLIVVVGADGRQGSSVIEALLEYSDKWHIRGITEDLTSTYSQELIRRGVHMVKCNINNREECCLAFTGAYGVFAITNYWNATDGGEYEQAFNLIEAARKVNVQHFITSGIPDTAAFEKNQFDLPLHSINKTQLENYIRRLPSDSTFVHVTFIHAGFYYQNFITFFVPYTENIEFRYPILSYGRIPIYDVRDTGKIVRVCFEHPERWGHRQTVPIVAEQLTMEEICKTIREVSEQDIQFIPLSYDEALVKLHRETVNNLRWYNEFGSTDERQAEKTKEIYPKIKTFVEWVRETQWLME